MQLIFPLPDLNRDFSKMGLRLFRRLRLLILWKFPKATVIWEATSIRNLRVVQLVACWASNPKVPSSILGWGNQNLLPKKLLWGTVIYDFEPLSNNFYSHESLFLG